MRVTRTLFTMFVPHGNLFDAGDACFSTHRRDLWVAPRSAALERNISHREPRHDSKLSCGECNANMLAVLSVDLVAEPTY